MDRTYRSSLCMCNHKSLEVNPKIQVFAVSFQNRSLVYLCHQFSKKTLSRLNKFLHTTIENLMKCSGESIT